MLVLDVCCYLGVAFGPFVLGGGNRSHGVRGNAGEVQGFEGLGVEAEGTMGSHSDRETGESDVKSLVAPGLCVLLEHLKHFTQP